MDWIVNAANWFVGLFKTGGEVFISWMTGIVPLVLVLLVAMNSLIALIGEDKINKFAQGAGKNVVSRYLLLPFLSTFFLTNPMCFTMGRFLPERYKPGYYASTAQFCHTSLGIFPHINPGELFTWMGIASGIMALGLNEGEARGPLPARRRGPQLPRRLGHGLHHGVRVEAAGHHPGEGGARQCLSTVASPS